MEKLYNNIILKEEYYTAPSDSDHIFYLENPPEVINVTSGRQLFVDDFLIESTDLAFHPHKAVKYAGNPVLFSEKSWEIDGLPPAASPLSGGVWYDEDEHLFKMWYHAGWQSRMAYAISTDGIHWERPELDVIPGTNLILDYDMSGNQNSKCFFRPDTTAFFIDYDAKDKSEKYKFTMTNPNEGNLLTSFKIGASPDGVHWDHVILTEKVGDCLTAYYNPFRKKWIYSIRSGWKNKTRSREYYECDNLLDGIESGKPVPWLATDEKDKPNPYIQYNPQLYNVNAIAYESIILGWFDIFYGPENYICAGLGMPKITETQPMFSRDGYHFKRSREALIGASFYKGAWDRGYVKSVCGGTIIHGNELWIYYSGFAGDEDYRSKDELKAGLYRNGATGLAKLRRDGFVSMKGCGTLLTRKLEFTDKCSLHVNIDGAVQVSVLDEEGSILAVSEKYVGNQVNHQLRFHDFSVSSLEGSVFRLRFDIDGELYSFGFADSKGDFGGAHAAGIVL